MYSKLNVALAVALSGIISEIKRHIGQKSRFYRASIAVTEQSWARFASVFWLILLFFF